MSQPTKSPFSSVKLTPEQVFKRDVKNMLIENRQLATEYLSSCTLMQLRKAVNDMRLVFDIMDAIMSSKAAARGIIYNMANTISVGFNDGINVTEEIKLQNMWNLEGKLHISKYMLNLLKIALNFDTSSQVYNALTNRLFSFGKNSNSTERCINALVNMTTVMDLVAHLCCRKSYQDVRAKYYVQQMIKLVSEQNELADMSLTLTLKEIWNQFNQIPSYLRMGESDPSITLGVIKPLDTSTTLNVDVYGEVTVLNDNFNNRFLGIDEDDKIYIEHSGNGKKFCSIINVNNNSIKSLLLTNQGDYEILEVGIYKDTTTMISSFYLG